MKKLILVLIFSFMPIIAQADQWVFGNVQTLEDYANYGGGYYEVLIKLKDQYWGGAGNGATNCTKRFRLKIGPNGITENEKDRIFSLMLSAYMGNKPVVLFVDTSSGPNCIVLIGRIG